MDIKSKIIEKLEKEHYTFSDLAGYLHMSEDDLTAALNNRSLELRSLEDISKTLRVPLYSFFRAEQPKFDYTQKPYHVNRLWTGDDTDKTKATLLQEIDLLKQIIALKEQHIAKMSS
jgi:transcriptional regulator with XRE-family HTH domain